MPSANRMTTAATIDADEIEGRYPPLGGYSPSADLEAPMAVVEKNLRPAGAQA